MAVGQLKLDLGSEPAGGGPLLITSSRMGHLADALERLPGVGRDRLRAQARNNATSTHLRQLEAPGLEVTIAPAADAA